MSRTVPMLSTPESLLELCHAIDAEGVMAFDTEFIGENSYTPRLCLVQVATPSQTVMIDPLGLDMTPFWQRVANPAIETILFAGYQDLLIGYLTTGLVPANVFDLQVAAGLAGLPYPCSYGNLVQAVTGQTLDQKMTFSDWARRPLSSRQLAYALEDVVHLLHLRAHIGGILERAARVSWLREEMARLESADLYDPAQRAGFANIRNHHKLHPRQLAVLDRLVQWREQTARRLDVPARRLVPDECLLDCARQLPKSARGLRQMRNFPPQAGDALPQEILEVLNQGQQVPRAHWPRAEDPREPDETVALLMDLASALGRSACLAAGVSHKLYANKADYQALATAFATGRPPTDQGLRLLTGWRDALAGPALRNALTGQTGLRLHRDAAGPRLAADGL